MHSLTSDTTPSVPIVYLVMELWVVQAVKSFSVDATEVDFTT